MALSTPISLVRSFTLESIEMNTIIEQRVGKKAMGFKADKGAGFLVFKFLMKALGKEIKEGLAENNQSEDV